MLMKTTDGVVTKYVYGRGLIGEETNGIFKTYHFDYRGSTVAITDINGNVTDRFEYDTYGKLTSRTGNSDVIFLYNGRDGVVTDANGLIYMRARYYSPELRRFVNADILAGRIDNAVTLNRYAYANGNPVSMIDPRGLSAERLKEKQIQYINDYIENSNDPVYELLLKWGVKLTETDKYSGETKFLFDGVVFTLSVDVTVPVFTDIEINDNISADEIKSPELMIGDVGLQVGAHVDKERLSVGTSSTVSYEEYSYETKYQIGLYSEAYMNSLTYEPEDPNLPSVTISVDMEIHHLAKVGVAVAAVGVAYAPELLAAAAPTAVEFLSRLGNLSPNLVPVG